MNQVKVTERVQKQLFELQDLQYRDFQAKLLPTIEKETVIGVRMPVLRKFAKGYGKTEEAKEFLKILPHQYYDENNLHGLLIEQIKDYDRCLAELERFLPYIDNWATCDMLAVKVMKNHLDTFIEEICHWMKSDCTYTIRFGIGMLMRYYLDDFIEENRLDTLVLGCTHFPIVAENIHRLYPDLRLISSSREIATAVSIELKNRNLEADEKTGENVFYASDISDSFVNMIQLILGEDREKLNIQFKNLDL